MGYRFVKIRPRAVILTCIMLAILLSLGAWQVKRLAWKTDLLATIAARAEAPVLPLPETITAPDELAFGRYTLAGNYLSEQSFKLGPRPFQGRTGYYVVTPFQRASGGIVLVNRGWLGYVAPAVIPQDDDAFTQITVRVRPYETKSFFMPDNDVGAGKWTWFDIPAIAATLQTGNANIEPIVGDVIGDAPSDPALPIPVTQIMDLPNDHKYYATFWFTMAGVLLGIFVISHVKKTDAA